MNEVYYCCDQDKVLFPDNSPYSYLQRKSITVLIMLLVKSDLVKRVTLSSKSVCDLEELFHSHFLGRDFSVKVTNCNH
jgi:hypothetical protein